MLGVKRVRLWYVSNHPAMHSCNYAFWGAYFGPSQERQNRNTPRTLKTGKPFETVRSGTPSGTPAGPKPL